MLVGFHGYGETADAMMANLRAIGRSGSLTSDRWCLVSVQALHRFYTRQQDVVASWMTRQDRELEIEANTAYVWSVVRAVEQEYHARRPLVFVGFSQGVAMAYRAAVAGDCDGLIVLAGDVPPDIASDASSLPKVLLGRGRRDEWYTEQKAAADLDVLRGGGVDVTEHVFDAGHEWDATVVAAAQQFLARLR
jgi:predicted esterase